MYKMWQRPSKPLERPWAPSRLLVSLGARAIKNWGIHLSLSLSLLEKKSCWILCKGPLSFPFKDMDTVKNDHYDGALLTIKIDPRSKHIYIYFVQIIKLHFPPRSSFSLC